MNKHQASTEIPSHVILFGGTFDPVHQGHIKTAIQIQQALHYDQFIFLPCKIPVLDKEPPRASRHDRIAMLALALQEHKSSYHFKIDAREIARETPSYMVPTLASYRLEWGSDLPITLLMGLDTFYQLPRWYQWEKLLKLCNILVMRRPHVKGEDIPNILSELLVQHETQSLKSLLSTPHGLIGQIDAGAYSISSTGIRQSLQTNQPLPKNSLTPAVIEYIQTHHLYQI